MKYIVDELFLTKYKELFDEYGCHTSRCGLSDFWGNVDHCTCGYLTSIRELRELELRTVFKFEKS